MDFRVDPSIFSMEKTRKLNNLPPEQKQITEREYRECQNALKNVKKVVAAATQDGTTQAQVSSTTTTVLPELALLASKFASPPISMSSVTSGGFGSLSICTCDLSSSPRYCGRSWTGSRKESAALVVCFLHVRGAPDAPALLRSPFEMR